MPRKYVNGEIVKVYYTTRSQHFEFMGKVTDYADKKYDVLYLGELKMQEPELIHLKPIWYLNVGCMNLALYQSFSYETVCQLLHDKVLHHFAKIILVASIGTHQVLEQKNLSGTHSKLNDYWTQIFQECFP